MDENVPLQETYLKQMRLHPVFLRQLEEVLAHHHFKTALDINTGISIAADVLRSGVVDSVDSYNTSPNANYKNDGPDFRQMGKHGDDIHRFNGIAYDRVDVVTFLLCLPWIVRPEREINRIISKYNPKYVLVSDPLLPMDRINRKDTSYLKQQVDASRRQHSYDSSVSISDAWRLYKYQLLEVLSRYSSKSNTIEKEIEDQGYYPLIVIRDDPRFVLRLKAMFPSHRIRTVMYSKDKPDRLAYDDAKYIFQINTICNLKCPFCYVEKTNEQMDETVYLRYLQNVKEGELITLRGGEPFFSSNFMSGFLKPAISRGIRVLVESNGQFTGMPNYKQYLDMLTYKNVEVRLSLDREHFDYLENHVKKERLGRLAMFIKDAEARSIKFSLTALGLGQNQIKAFLNEINFEPYVDHKKIKPLTKYSHIEDLPINNTYIDVKGISHDNVVDYSNRSYSEAFRMQRSFGMDSKQPQDVLWKKEG